jgi:hypothetical protein
VRRRQVKGCDGSIIDELSNQVYDNLRIRSEETNEATCSDLILPF